MNTQIIPGKHEELKALSDSQVLKLSVKNPDNFSELVDRYEPAFMRKALSMLGNGEDAADAVQETFVRIYTAAKRFEERSGAQFSSWGYAILVNRCLTIIAKRSKRAIVSFDREPELADVIADPGATREHEALLAHEYVLSLLSRLPEVLRSVVTLKFIQGKPNWEIAKLLNISDSALRTRLHRAKNALKAVHLSMNDIGAKISDKTGVAKPVFATIKT